MKILNMDEEIKVLREVECNLCHGREVRVIYPSTVNPQADQKFECDCTNDGHGEYYQLVRCRNCGLQYSSPRPDFSIIEDSYEEVQDEMYKEEVQGRIKTFQRNLKNIERYQKTGKLLDVGCSMGVFLSEAVKKGWQVEGLEPSLWCVQQGEKLFNLRINQGTVRNLKDLFKEEFDVVTMWDVLEHVDDPMETLKLCRNVLKKEGLFVFSTVDMGSLFARMMGKKWPWLMKMHIYYFDRKNIRQYLEKAGFEVLSIEVYKHTISFDYLLYKIKKLNSLAYSFLSLIRKTFPFLSRFYVNVAMGDFMIVYAKKI
ncbi:MAG: class I SAM-dependent methyltransferase [Candidatus Omnitrophica bacterium]|nr:class I SAM-dependent methyltransferase [Candidatus Omnitrophota bacterium]